MTDTEIIIGADINNPLYRFSRVKGHIKSISGVMSSSMAGDELSIDKVTFIVDLDFYRDTLYSPTNADAYQDTNDELYAVRGDIHKASERLRTLPSSTPIRIYYGGELFGKFYSGEVKRISSTQFTVPASSAIQLLADAQDHMGGLYNGVTFVNLLTEIIGGKQGASSNGIIPVTGGIINFYVSSDVANIKVYGWLPKATPRDNIHQMLFAHSVNIFKSDDGDILFGHLVSTESRNIPDGRVFLGGSVTYTPPATQVELAEHTYVLLPTDEEVVLMDNTSGGILSDETIVTFNDGPVHDLSAEGQLTILDSGVNYARIRGVGILKGKKYHHTTTLLITETNDAGAEKTVKSDTCTLVSPLNGESVLARLASYYLSAREIRADISIDAERPGDLLRFKSAFGEIETAFLAAMNYKLSGFVRATCTLIADYIPANAGNEYKNIQIVKASGTWVVPAGITKIMVVCIGGGDGGGCGGDGGQAEDLRGAITANFAENNTKPGAGGEPGIPGAGGKIFRATLSVTTGQSFSVSIGMGGSGGGAGRPTGYSGGPTTFGDISSASGYSNAAGFTDLINGDTYAATGDAGVRGGDGDGRGGQTNTANIIIVDGVKYRYGDRGDTEVGEDEVYSSNSPYVFAKGRYEAAGGFGGGAAYKANGGKGRKGGGDLDLLAYYQIGGFDNAHAYVDCYLGIGGDGADAQPPPMETVPGKGGTGGNGGGGVGAFGAPSTATAVARRISSSTAPTRAVAKVKDGEPLGTPGKGSAGGSGAPGCVLIYY